MKLSASVQSELLAAGVVIGPPVRIVTDRVELPLPPSTNNLFATFNGHRIPSREYRAWREQVAPLLECFRPAVVKPFGIVYTLHGGDGLNEARDIGNLEKALTDALVDATVIPGDSLRAGLWDIRLKYRPRKEGAACVEVRIETGAV